MRQSKVRQSLTTEEGTDEMSSVNFVLNVVGDNKSNRQENDAMFDRLRSGDESAREQIILRNLPLISIGIRRLKPRGQLIDDLFQAGVIGLSQAINDFDHTRGISFSTYAIKAINREMREEMLRLRSPVRTPINLLGAAFNLLNGDDPTKAKYNRKKRAGTGLSMRNIKKAMQGLEFTHAIGSWSSDYNEATGSVVDPCLDLKDERTNPNERPYEECEHQKLQEALSRLGEKERAFIELLYGMRGDKLTLKQIGTMHGLSKERIRQINKVSMGMLREAMAV